MSYLLPQNPEWKFEYKEDIKLYNFELLMQSACSMPLLHAKTFSNRNTASYGVMRITLIELALENYNFY